MNSQPIPIRESELEVFVKVQDFDWNSTMRYREGPFLEELCQRLDLPWRPRLIRSNMNLVYDCETVVLRLTPNSFRSPEEVNRELHWLRFVASRTDDVVQLIDDGSGLTMPFSCGDEDFTVARFERIDGAPIEDDHWNSQHFERLGSLTGFLHRIGHEYSPPADTDLLEWDAIPEAHFSRHLPDDDRNLPGVYRDVADYMASMPRVADSYGPIHYDIHHGNYLITPDGRLVLLDFESSCRGHYINDIAIVLYYASLHDCSHSDTEFNESFLTAFWRGYETEHRVAKDEIRHIPWLILYRSLMVYSFVTRLWTDDPDDEQQRHLDKVARSVEATRALVST